MKYRLLAALVLVLEMAISLELAALGLYLLGR